MNFSANDRVEAEKYAKIMTEQFQTYMRRNADNRIVGNDYKSIKSVLAEARAQFPDLKINREFDLV